ncbi:hypothetical protein TrCOL_g7431 [Triparma columacea]|jgi:hypothetical protein|uniref:Uncharacterized protein n=1 Tax=Triparma columacea TaxID=722753 RepID=A0A9W7GQU8_9STRA|nr:hypothetical protein TrCOL_g7431 [Triparma columacea]
MPANSHRLNRPPTDFKDTFGQPLDSHYAKAFTERDSRVIDERGLEAGQEMEGHGQTKEKYATFKDWLAHSRKLEPKLDEKKIKRFEDKKLEKSFFDTGGFEDDDSEEEGDPDLLGTKMPVRRFRGDPARKRFPQGPAARTKFIPGYSGHYQGRICKEDVREAVGASEEESCRRQDLSVNLASTMKVGYDFSVAAPTRWGMSSSQSAMAEAIVKSRRPKFTLTERTFRRNESDFIKHGCLRMKNERIAKESVLRIKKEKNLFEKARSVKGNRGGGDKGKRKPK